VLNAIQNVEFINMEEADNCCGMGGSFKLSYPEISRKIQLRKAKNINATKADFLLTECQVKLSAQLRSSISHELYGLPLTGCSQTQQQDIDTY
jgi:Fe-S oxidoreductase